MWGHVEGRNDEIILEFQKKKKERKVIAKQENIKWTYFRYFSLFERGHRGAMESCDSGFQQLTEQES